MALSMETKNWVNVFVLGFGFFLLFSAFQTAMFIQTLTISSYLSPKCNQEDGNNSVAYGVLHSQKLADRVGYISGAIIYLMVAIGNWISVSVVAMVGAKWSLIVSGALYVVYIACLIRPLIYTIFIGAFILGTGGGVLWTAQGQILIQNSSKERMGTTSGIFWLMLETSLVVGSIYVFTYFYLEKGDENKLTCLPHTQNMILFGVLTVVAVSGIVVLLFITPTDSLRSRSSGSQGSINTPSSSTNENKVSTDKENDMLQMRACSMNNNEKEENIVQNDSIEIRSQSIDHENKDDTIEKNELGPHSNVDENEEDTIMENDTSNEREPLMVSRQSSVGMSFTKKKYHPIIQAVVNALKMLATKKMILLSITFIYTGYELNFWSGVYGTIVGHTLSFPRYYVGATLFFIGLGEIIGGGLFGILGSYTNRWGRDTVVILGLFCHLLCFFLTFLFFPDKAIAADVNKEDCYGALGKYFIYSNVYIVMVIAFLLGFGDACYNTQIYSLIGVLYPSDDLSAPAMALYKFFQSITAMVGFFTSTVLDLQWQLLALVILAVIGALTFCVVEWQYHQVEEQRERIFTTSYEEPSKYSIKKTDSTSTLGDEGGFMSDSSAY